MTLYTESFRNEKSMQGGSLRVVRRKSGTITIVAYIGCEYPEVLINGTLEECRAAWASSKVWIKKQMGI